MATLCILHNLAFMLKVYNLINQNCIVRKSVQSICDYCRLAGLALDLLSKSLIVQLYYFSINPQFVFTSQTMMKSIHKYVQYLPSY